MKKKSSLIKRWIALLGALALMAALPACDMENAVLGETRSYGIQSDIRSLEISVNAADFVIRHADAFSVESNLKYLSVSEENGVLTITDEAPKRVSYEKATLTLSIPEDAVFETIRIFTGAARLTADALSGERVSLTIGAGDASIQVLHAGKKAEIKGGAGRISISGGTLQNLSLEMGVGELNLSAALLGESSLTLGVGASNVTLLGEKETYTLEIEKGLGSITLDGKSVSGFDRRGDGENHVEIEGGIGQIRVDFETGA